MIMLVRLKDKTVKTKMATGHTGCRRRFTNNVDLRPTASSRNTCCYIKSRMAFEPIATNADAVMEVRGCSGGREIQNNRQFRQSPEGLKTWQKNRTRGETREADHVRVKALDGSSGLARATVTQIHRSRLRGRHVRFDSIWQKQNAVTRISHGRRLKIVAGAQDCSESPS